LDFRHIATNDKYAGSSPVTVSKSMNYEDYKGNTITRTQELLDRLKNMDKLTYKNAQGDSSKADSTNERQEENGLHRENGEDKPVCDGTRV
jgi:hypothetical protein